MDKIITIDGRDVGFRANALTPRIYRHRMGRDIIRDLSKLQQAFEKAVNAAKIEKPGTDATEAEIEKYEKAVNGAQMSVTDLEVFEDVAYIMASQYDPECPKTPDEWLEGFDTFSIYSIFPQILDLWIGNQKTTATPKKK